jgi:signal peptidase I
MKIRLRDVVIVIIVFVLLFGVMQTSVGAYRILQVSMSPAFQPADWIVVDKLCYRFSFPARGEVIVLWPPEDVVPPGGNPYIKRVIGLPGEAVRIEDGRVYIQLKGSIEFLLLDEDPAMPASHDGTWSVPEGNYFVLGDNRDVSSDSSVWSDPFVPVGDIVGRARLRYWPLSRWGSEEYECRLERTEGAGPTSLDALPAVPNCSGHQGFRRRVH